MNMIVSILVIAGLLFSGGATVNAARNDLPNEPLYALKLWSEDVGLQLQNNPDQKVERLMELAQVRMQEMTKLASTGQAVPDQLQQRLQLHIQQALQICATQDDPAMDRTLLQIRDRLQQQDRDMEQLQLHAAQDVQPILQQTRTMLQQHLQLVDEGLLNHEMFRYAARNGFQFGQEEIVPPVQNGPGPQGGQPTDVPAGPNTNPGGPNTDPSGPGYGTGEPDPDPRGPNTDPGGPNTGATPSSPTGGGGAGGNNGGGSGSGGGGTGGSGSGSGSGSGGSGSTGGSGGGSGSGGSTGGGGSGGN